MNELAHDGRVVLCKERLKALRREFGVSQEKMAFLCAEKGLCVSVASLKRAETNKNVLYRTARDISRFYKVDLAELVEGGHQSVPESTLEGNDSSAINVKRHFILFSCRLMTTSKHDHQEFVTSLAHIAEQYEAQLLGDDEEGIHYAFGLGLFKGNEVRRSLLFSLRCLQLVKAMWGTQAQSIIGLSWSQMIAPVDDVQYVNKDALSDCSGWQSNSFILRNAPLDSIVINAPLKEQLGDEFTYLPLTLDKGTDSLYWQVKQRSVSVATSKVATPFVGRKIEVTQFKVILESAVEYDATQIVNLVGPAGIGKTRLVDEFCRVASLDGFNIHIASIFNFYVEQHQQAIPTLLKSLLRIGDDEATLLNTPPLSFDELMRRNQLVWLNETKHLPLLYSLLNWPLTKAWTALLDAMDTERLYAAQCQLIASIIQSESRKKPLLIVLEDYHWADKQLKHYIHGISDQLDDIPVVVLITSRPDESGSLLASSYGSYNIDVTHINPSPLSKKDSLKLSEYFADADTQYRQQCIEKAQGNPLFLEQLLKNREALLDDSLPVSLQSLIASRIESMTMQDQLAVRAASIVGQKFSLKLLKKLIANPDYDPTALVQANIISGVDDDYHFNHALIMEGIYLSISIDDRKRLHYLCGQWYSHDTVLQCHHMLKASHEDAIDSLAPAAQLLVQRYQFEEARELISVGLQMTAELKSTFLPRLHELNAEVYSRLGDTQYSLIAYENMFESADKPEDQVKALIGLANCLNTLDQFDKAQKVLDRAHAIATAENFILLLSRIYYLNGNFLFPKGQVQKCFDLQQKALHFARRAGDKELEARALGGLGDAAYAQGKMYSAHEYFTRCLTLCDEYDFKHVSAANLFMLGTVSIYHNDTSRALSVTEQSVHTAELVGHKRAEVVSRLTAAWILLDWLRLGEAKEHIDVGLRLAKEIGAKRFIPFLLESKARYYFYNDEKQNAIECIDDALEQVNTLNLSAFIGPWLLATRAYLSGAWAEARQYLLSGDEWLNKGCIGHNHYRFYTIAIESSLVHGQYNEAKQYADRLRTFTVDEETPWSNFYIQRAESIVNIMLSSEPSDSKPIHQLIQIAKDAKLLTALPVLENAVCNISAL